MNNRKRNNSPIVRIIIMLFFFLIIAGVFSQFTGMNTTSSEVTYNKLKTEIKDGNIEEITLQPENGVYNVAAVEKPEDDKQIGKVYTTTIPDQDEMVSDLVDLADDNDVKTEYLATPEPSTGGALLGQLLLIGLMLGGMFFILSRAMGGKNGAMRAGDNKAKKVTASKVKFDDVIGYDEEKQELIEIIDFLKNPKKYREMGAKVPNGVLLEGPPGTGKTLMAKAVAGEANVPFYTISGSDFIEMFVGVGASRVRNLFKEAKKESSAIVFIDEIDAIGSRDTGAPGGRNTEQEQTINALLVELDGFATEKGGVIIIGATNRSDKLDPALLRPGRFDRKVMIGLPQVKEREAILKYHAAKRKVAKDVKFHELAKSTTGMSGAQLEAVINEGAILAVREKRNLIEVKDVNEAVDRVLMGPAKVSNKYSDRDKQIVSYHESGHAITGIDLKDGNKVQKITIIPRRNAGGYVAYAPEEDEKFTTKSQMEAKLVSFLAGRAAEEIFLNEISAGAHNDFEKATRIARAMVTEYGMSSLGLYQYENSYRQNQYAMRSYSESKAEEIDAEINKILDESYEKAKEILIRRRDDMHLLARTIREVETLDGEEINYLLEHRELPTYEKGEVIESQDETTDKANDVNEQANDVTESKDQAVNEEK